MPYKDPEARRAHGRKYRAANREERIAYGRKYRAEHREELRAYNRAYSASHREQENARSRAYNAEHPEKVNARTRRYMATDSGYATNRAANSRVAARRRDAVLDPELTSAILAQIFRGGENCAWCRNSVPLRERMIDHRIAICFGGEHAASNIQILCKSCEKQKSVAERSIARKIRNGVTKADFALVA